MIYQLNEERDHIQLYYDGDAVRAYDFFGAHMENWNGRDGVVFRVWAPNAKSVSVVGDFNGWNQEANLMYKINEGGIWEVFIEGIGAFTIYKFCVESPWGEKISLDFFIPHPKGGYIRERECFRERAYETAELKEMLASAGFEVKAVFGDMSFEAPENNEQRLYFVAEKL